MNRFAALTAPILFVLAATTAGAAVTTETVRYEIDGTEHIGYLAYDDSVDGPRPGVLVIHEWWGLNDYAKRRARELAGLGYVAFAADMYGGGRTTGDPEQAGAWSDAAKPHLRERAGAALARLAETPRVDAGRLAAIGFCFGGTTVLQLAYSGADLDAAVSFHGHLPTPAEDDEIGASILVLHGAADPYVPPADVTAWEKAMNARAGLDWHLTAYGHAEHAFTNQGADEHGLDGVAYDATAARRAWAHMRVFLEQTLDAGDAP
ncbi:dienelactone hydrolase-like enzyme [Salinisphaera sp. PC39]|uniref:dienelactone hydrolase family protein n=1 Tax=Salinisphaera sp. PC39 TaxID=1304156 RepID=UPI00334169A8